MSLPDAGAAAGRATKHADRNILHVKLDEGEAREALWWARAEVLTDQRRKAGPSRLLTSRYRQYLSTPGAWGRPRG